jgi:hypothetical protein
VYVLTQYYATGSSDASYAILYLGAVAGGSTTSFSYDTSEPADHFGYYTVVGLYNYAAGAVTTGMNETAAADAVSLTKQWADVFAGHDSEANVAIALKTEDPILLAWLAAYGAQVGSTLKLVNFSGATDGGTAYAVAHCPLPPSLLLLAPPFLGLALLFRRRKGA